MKQAIAALLVLLVAAELMVEPASALTCRDVSSSISSCVPYVTGRQAAPTGQCCNGVRRLKTMARTTADRRAACNCMKRAAGRIRGLREPSIAGLPGRCGVSLPYRLSMSTNCATIP